MVRGNARVAGVAGEVLAVGEEDEAGDVGVDVALLHVEVGVFSCELRRCGVLQAGRT